jgi:periplasmic nitrate reductase NapE
MSMPTSSSGDAELVSPRNGIGEASAANFHRRRQERRLYVFILVFLFPVLSVMVVGGYGLAVWIYQTLMGPPGPGS